MRFETFQARARAIFAEIPPSYKEGVDGIEITRRTVTHPSNPDIFTLGECISEQYPSDFGGAGEIRSVVALYYGSFLELSRSEDDWDWEGELYETITHELRHHLEHLALDDSLGDLDRAEDENFARRDGERFDPFFFRDGQQLGPGLFEVDGDLFIETGFDPRREGPISVELNGSEIVVGRPAVSGDIHFLRLPDPPMEVEGDVFIVLVRKLGTVRSLLRLARSIQLEVLDGEAEVLAGPGLRDGKSGADVKKNTSLKQDQ